MSEIERFGAYAAAFEAVYENDDWSLLDEYFSEDAVYETLADPPFGGRHEGRETLFKDLKQTLDTFDRRFDSRELELLEGPEMRDGAVWIRWRATYRVGDAPPLSMDGEERATFQGDRIVRLEDRMPPETSKAATEWFEAHAGKLKPV